MDSHLKGIPSLRTFTTGGLSGRDLECLCWKTNRSFHSEILRLSTIDEFLAHLLEGGDLSAGQSDPDLVGFLQLQLFRIPPQPRVIVSQKLTGPSPKSFSGFW